MRQSVSPRIQSVTNTHKYAHMNTYINESEDLSVRSQFNSLRSSSKTLGDHQHTDTPGHRIGTTIDTDQFSIIRLSYSHVTQSAQSFNISV